MLSFLRAETCGHHTQGLSPGQGPGGGGGGGGSQAWTWTSAVSYHPLPLGTKVHKQGGMEGGPGFTSSDMLPLAKTGTGPHL